MRIRPRCLKEKQIGIALESRFVTLAYKPSAPARDVCRLDRQVVLLACEDGQDGLGFFVSPDLWQVVHEGDLQIINDFKLDLSVRARRVLVGIRLDSPISAWKFDI